MISGSGLGDVVGPASAVNEDIAIFDGVTGKVIKDSGYKISDLGGGTGSTNADSLNHVLVTAPTPSSGHPLNMHGLGQYFIGRYRYRCRAGGWICTRFSSIANS